MQLVHTIWDVGVNPPRCISEKSRSGNPYLVGTIRVNPVDEIPVLVFHVLEADITQNTGIVEQDIDAAKGLDGGVDDSVTILNAVVVGHGLASGGPDLLNDDIGSLVQIHPLVPRVLQAHV